MIFLRRFKLIVKIISSLYPFIYFNLFFLKKRNLLTEKNTDMVIEGFPRSGNTFCVVSIMKFQKKLKIGHHTHAPANVKRAIKYKIPVVLLIRKPEDSIKSLMIMYPYISSSLASFWYYIFYRSLHSYRNDFLLVDFETLTQKFQILLEEYNKKFESSLIEHRITDKEEKDIFDQIKNIKNNESSLIAIPNIEKLKKKEEMKIDSKGLWLRKAKNVYLKYMNIKLNGSV